MKTPINVIITWATGMVGEWILHMCLESDQIAKILIINRSRYDYTHPKLTQIVHKNMFDLESIEDQLSGYDACYYAAWTTSLRKSDDEYFRITHDLTLSFARTLYAHNPEMTFCYVSGKGTDRTGKSRSSWINIKGKTEQDLTTVWFPKTYAYRPWFIEPIEGLQNTQSIYTYLWRTSRFFKTLFPGSYCTIENIGKSMIYVSTHGYAFDILECVDIAETSKKID